MSARDGEGWAHVHDETSWAVATSFVTELPPDATWVLQPGCSLATLFPVHAGADGLDASGHPLTATVRSTARTSAVSAIVSVRP